MPIKTLHHSDPVCLFLSSLIVLSSRNVPFAKPPRCLSKCHHCTNKQTTPKQSKGQTVLNVPSSLLAGMWTRCPPLLSPHLVHHRCAGRLSQPCRHSATRAASVRQSRGALVETGLRRRWSRFNNRPHTETKPRRRRHPDELTYISRWHTPDRKPGRERLRERESKTE